MLELARERLQLGERAIVVEFRPRPAQPVLDGRTVALGEIMKHVSLLVADAALDGHRAFWGVQIGGSEEDAIEGGDVDAVEVDPCLRDPAGKVGEDAGVVLEHGETVLSPQ